MKKFFYFLIFSFFIFPLALHAEDWPRDDAGVDIASGVTGSFEASGVSWYFDSEGQTKVVVVSDQSGGSAHLCTLNLDGSDVSCADVSSCDLESVVVVDTESSLIYIGCEGNASSFNEIREFDLEAMGVTGNTWDLPASFKASTGFESYNMEALAFVPNEFLPSSYTASSSGGLFYASLQQSSSIVVFDVDLSSPGRVTEVDSFTPSGGTTDMGDMYFSVETGLLYILYDGANLLLEVNPETKETLHSYSIPTVSTTDDEGFALLVDCDTSFATVLIADDTQTLSVAELYVYENYPVTCLTSSSSSDGSDTSDGSDAGTGSSSTDTSGSTTSGSETTGSESGGTSGTDTLGSTTSGSESTAGESSGSSSGTDSGSSTTSGTTGGSSQTSNKSGSFFTAPGCSFQAN